jgi:hypothetical protein
LYFASRNDAWSGERDPSWRIYSTADGRVVRTEPDEPQLAGPYLVRWNHPEAGWQLEYLDPATSESRGTVTSSKPLVFEPAWCIHQSGVLVGRYNAEGGALWAVRRDGSEKYIAGIAAPRMASSNDLVCFDADDRNLLLRSVDGLHTVDMQTGATRSYTTATPDWAALTPGRVIWRTGTTTTAEGVVQHLAWADRNGQQTGTIDVPFAEKLETLGDDLLVMHKPAGGADYVLEARRISVDDGTVGAPLLTDARGGTSLEDGTFLVGRPTSIEVISADGGVRELVPVPRARERAWALAMSGDRVVASWNDGVRAINGTDNHPMSDLTLSPDASWSQQRTSISGLQSSVEPIQLGGEVLVTRPEKLETDNVEPKYVVEWPGGRREIRQYGRSLKLGRGGRLMTYHPMDGSTPGLVVEDARTGERYATADFLFNTAIDGTWVWTTTTDGLSGRDVVTGQTKTVKTSFPDSCSTSSPLAVVERWATYCGVIVDLVGVLPDRRLTENHDWVLGNGFVAGRRWATDWRTREVVVIDLNDPDMSQRVYGPAADDGGRDDRGTIAVDETGKPRLVYVDQEDQVRLIALDWLHEEPPMTRPDKTAPALTSASTGPRLSPTRSLSVSYTFTDPTPAEVEPASGLASYDVRIQQRSVSTAPYGEWRQPWSATTATRVTMTAGPGVDTCFQVRGRDKLGNVSAWSASRCSMVDGTKPTLVSRSAGDRVRLSSSVKFTYAFKDNGVLTTYDVAYRTAAAGRLLGSWVYPAGWQGIRSTSVSFTAGLGSDSCFMVRARDAAGNTSPWAPSTCTSIPLDDRALTAAGSVSRTSTTMAFQNTASRLNKSGARLYRSGQVGNRVAVVALVGPGQGTVEVWHGSHKLGRLSLASTNWGRRVFYLPTTSYLTGTVSVVSVSTAYSSIDGLSVLRY